MMRLSLVVALVVSGVALIWFFQVQDRSGGALGASDPGGGFAVVDHSEAELTPAENRGGGVGRASLVDEEASGQGDEGGQAAGAIVGKVEAADGLALGEPVRIQARWFESTEDGKRGAKRSFQVDVNPGGSFELPLDRDLLRLELDVLADFLSLARPLRVARAEEGPLLLKVDRGALLLVELMGAAALEADAQLGEAFKITAGAAAGPSGDEYTAFVGEDGGIRIGGLPPEKGWWVRLAAGEFIDAEIAVSSLEPNTVRRVQLPVERGVSAIGVVSAPNGAPVAGALVKLRSWKQADARSVNGREESVETDRDGAFLVGGVIAGEMTLAVSADGMLFNKQSLGEGIDGERIDAGSIEMEGGARVSGLVRWEDGEPVSKALVRVTPEARSWKSGEQVKTDKEGRFEVTGLVGETFRVRASKKKRKAKHRQVAESTALDGVDVALVLVEGLTVRGRVVDDEGTGLAKFSVKAVPLGINSGASTSTISVKKGAGDFELLGLSPGTWELHATARGQGNSTRVRVHLPEGGHEITLSIPRQCVFAGGVVNESGSPVAAAQLNGGGQSATADEEGQFRFEGVDPGVFELRVTVDGKRVLTREDSWALVPGEQRTEEVVRLRRGGRVLGVIHEGTRTGIEFQATLRKDGEFSSRTVAVDGEGRFLFEAIPAGDYWAGLSVENETDWVEGHRRSRAIPVHVEEDSDAHVVLGDPHDYPIRIFGEVRKGGESAEGLLIYVYEEGGEARIPKSLARSDENGEYEVHLRTPGRYLFGVGEGQMQLTRHMHDLSDEPEQRIDFEIPVGELRGRALLKGGTPVAGTLYTLFYEGANRNSIRAGDFLCAYTRADGTFRFEAVAPGTYSLRAGNYLSGHPTEGTVFVDNIVVPEEGEAPEIELTIPDGAVVDLMAQDSSGMPLPGCTMDLVTEAGHPSQLFDHRQTGHAGSLRFTGLGPGVWIATVKNAEGRTLGQQSLVLTEGEERQVIVVCSP